MAIRKAPLIAQPQAEACCPPIGAERFSARDAGLLSSQFAALADRCGCMLSVLATAPDGAVCRVTCRADRQEPAHCLPSSAGPERGWACHGAARRQEHLVRGRPGPSMPCARSVCAQLGTRRCS